MRVFVIAPLLLIGWLACAQTQRPAANSFDAVSKAAAAAREANQTEKAIVLYRKAVALRPSWDEGWWYLGTTFYDLDRYSDGRDALRRFVELKPKAGPGWALLGLCGFELRDYTRALAHLQRAEVLGLGSYPQVSAVARFHLALLETRFEQFEAGMQDLSILVRQGNESPEIVEAMGLSVLRMAFLPAEIPPDRREKVLMAGRAAVDAVARRVTEAQRELQELVDRFPDTPNVHYAYGTFLLEWDPDAALREFNRELEISPGHVPARLQIAFEYIKRSNYSAALPFAQKAVELDPKSFAAHNALGRAFLGQGETARALNELETAVKLAPDSPETRFSLATAYAKVGRKAEAEAQRAEFTRLTKLRESRAEIAGNDGRPSAAPN